MEPRAGDVVRQRAQHFHVVARQAHLFFRFAQRRVDAVRVPLLLPAAGETDLPRMRAQVGIALGQQHGQAIATLHQRHQHGGIAQASAAVVDARFVGQLRRPGRRQLEAVPDEVDLQARLAQWRIAQVGVDDGKGFGIEGGTHNNCKYDRSAQFGAAAKSGCCQCANAANAKRAPSGCPS
ncbi:hypothetical protein CO2235_60149 [Cupriavidus oxalaticus]|uniref:Uncharacterized protein n=1 Tax=Cupriavidus oxalaticus TaxID=96344 RepID=A0A375GAA8_9BURK|nr:hypothetical protein CO2235_60149 [Cupriavidus oxalaticus]